MSGCLVDQFCESKRQPALIGKEPDELIYKFAGLNHFHWHKVADSHGNDVTMDIIDKMYEEDNGLPKNIFDVPFYKEQLEQMKMIPCGYHRYYYRQEEMLNHAIEEYKTVGTRAQQVKQTEAELFELYKDPELDHKPEQLQKRGGAYYSDAACETIASIYANKNTQIVVSTKNEGAVPDLPADCVVEVTAYVGGQGARITISHYKHSPSTHWFHQGIRQNVSWTNCLLPTKITCRNLRKQSHVLKKKASKYKMK